MPHPSKNAPHTAGGFTTGVWEGTMLDRARRRISRRGLVWRNGVPHSDQATMTEHFVRHGDMLTVTMILEDPVYWEEPFIRSATFELDPARACCPSRASRRSRSRAQPGEVPHYLPGENPYLSEVAGDVQPAARSRARRRGDDVSGVREEAARDLQAAGEVHGVLLRGNGTGDAERQQGVVPGGAAARPGICGPMSKAKGQRLKANTS